MLVGLAGLGEIGVEQPHPRFLKGTKEHHFVRVAAGAGHSLALTSSGQVWSFGQGSFGTLGMPSYHALLDAYLVSCFASKAAGNL